METKCYCASQLALSKNFNRFVFDSYNVHMFAKKSNQDKNYLKHVQKVKRTMSILLINVTNEKGVLKYTTMLSYLHKNCL